MLNIVTYRKMQIKTKTTYYLIPVRMANIKKKRASIGENMEKLELLYMIGGNIDRYTHCGKQNGVS